ncbi:MAG: hypothetical protein ABSG44_10315 [Thermodesulfobacteriota bacterium]
MATSLSIPIPKPIHWAEAFPPWLNCPEVPHSDDDGIARLKRCFILGAVASCLELKTSAVSPMNRHFVLPVAK